MYQESSPTIIPKVGQVWEDLYAGGRRFIILDDTTATIVRVFINQYKFISNDSTSNTRSS